MKNLFFIVLLFFIACKEKQEKTTPVIKPITESIYASGIVVSKNQYQAFATVSGIVDEIYVSEGDSVSKGTPILFISSKTQQLNKENARLTAEYADFKSNQGKLNEAKQLLELSKSKMKNDSALLERQKKAAKKGNMKRVFVVLDDLAYDNTIMKKPVLRFIFMNGRHLNIFLIFSSQYVADLGPPAIRANIDVLFVCREAIQANRWRLYNYFFGCFDTFEDFNKVLNACTEDYGVLVLDNTKLSNDVTSCVFHWRAKVRDDFRMGSRSFWKFSKDRARSDDSDDEEGNNGVKLLKGHR
jgi:hypothetical protein